MSDPITLTLDRGHIGALNDALYALLNDPESDEEDLVGYRELRDDLQRQLNKQHESAEGAPAQGAPAR